MKILVTVVYLIETAQTLIVTNDCFNTYARHFGDAAALGDVQNEWLAAPTLTSIGMFCLLTCSGMVLRVFVVSCMVQISYAYRIWILSRQKWVPLVVCTVCVAPLLVGCPL